MKTVFIPKGESRSYEYLVTDNLVVNGHLNVVNGVKAGNISGSGVWTVVGDRRVHRVQRHGQAADPVHACPPK